MPLMDSMPKSTEMPRSGREEHAEQTIDLDSLKQTGAGQSQQEHTLPSPLATAAHGKLGRMRRYASGKMTISVGDIEFELMHMMNSPSSMTNALIVDGEYNQAFDVGNVGNQLVAIPDISKLLLHQ